MLAIFFEGCKIREISAYDLKEKSAFLEKEKFYTILSKFLDIKNATENCALIGTLLLPQLFLHGTAFSIVLEDFTI